MCDQINTNVASENKGLLNGIQVLSKTLVKYTRLLRIEEKHEDSLKVAKILGHPPSSKVSSLN